jgi:hypothetical protein
MKKCSSLSSVSRLLFTFNTFHKARQSAYYVEILKQLCEGIIEKGLNFDPMIGFSTMTMLQLTRFCQFLAQKPITKMEHPPSSSDLAPKNFWLFPEIKSALKG